MQPASSAGVRAVTPPPASMRAVGTLARVDYQDTFAVDVADLPERRPEQWARLMLQGAPAHLQASLVGAWLALGLRLGLPRSPGHILGWEVRSSTTDVALLGARSRVGMPAELVFRREGASLLFATLIQHDNVAVRATWAAIAPGHRQVVRQMLERMRAGARARP